MSTYPRRPKAGYDNAVDVVVRLHDPTDPSTERTAPLDPLEDEGEFHHHDGMVTALMMFPA